MMYKRICDSLIIFALGLYSCGDGTSEIPRESFSSPEDQGLVLNAAISEASGLAVSRQAPTFLWTHNDSGDAARIFLLSNQGLDFGQFTLENIQAVDWEDMTTAKLSGQDYLYIADIGDNQAQRTEVEVLRFPEPNLSAISSPQDGLISEMNIDVLRFVYPDGPRDAEALLLNSKGDIFIISKESNQAGVYRSLFPQSNSSLNTLEKMGTLNISSVTAGDASKGVLLKNYTQVFYWSGLNAQNEDWAKLLLEQEAQFLNYTLEPQGEAIAWQEDEGLFYTLSEEVSQEARLYLYRRQ